MEVCAPHWHWTVTGRTSKGSNFNNNNINNNNNNNNLIEWYVKRNIVKLWRNASPWWLIRYLPMFLMDFISLLRKGFSRKSQRFPSMWAEPRAYKSKKTWYFNGLQRVPHPSWSSDSAFSGGAWFPCTSAPPSWGRSGLVLSKPYHWGPPKKKPRDR